MCEIMGENYAVEYVVKLCGVINLCGFFVLLFCYS